MNRLTWNVLVIGIFLLVTYFKEHYDCELYSLCLLSNMHIFQRVSN